MASVILVLNDGTRLEQDPGAPWTMREQIDWESQFRASFATVYAAIGKEMEAQQIAQAAKEAGEAVEEAQTQHFRMTWMLWFAWHRLRVRGKVANKWPLFVDGQLADYEFVMPEPEPEPELAGVAAFEEVAPAADLQAPDPADPTVLPSPTPPPPAPNETPPATL